MVIFFKNPLVILTLTALLSSCIPGYLNKYQTSRDSPPDLNATNDPYFPAENAPSTASPVVKRSAPPSIYSVDKQTFRFSLNENDVWNSALDVLLRNYNLTIVDKNSGIITTEWDSFYLNKSIYRNKVSIRIKRMSWNAVDITIHNNVERLQDASMAGSVGAVWLPDEDKGDEVSRIVKNMAIVLNKQPPVFSNGIIANGDGVEKGGSPF